MRNYLEDIVRAGGEGIMIRKPLSVYELGRSHSIFKQKVHAFFCVVEHLTKLHDIITVFL